MSKQDHVTHYLPEYQQIIILAVEYEHKRPAHAGQDLENYLLTTDKWEVFKNITKLSRGVNGVYGPVMTLHSTIVPFGYDN